MPATVVPAELARPLYSAPTESADSDEGGFSGFNPIVALRRYWYWSLLFAVVVMVGVTAFTFLMKPVYEPEAHVEIDPPGSEVLSVDNHDNGPSGDFVTTKMQNLQSDGLALDVIHTLHLDQKPEFNRDAQPAASPKPSSDGAVQLTPAEDRALYAFNQSRKVTQTPGSQLITVSVDANNAMEAAQLTNTLLDLFIARDFKAREDTIAQWQRQLDDIKKRMDDSNHALTAFENAKGFSAIGDNGNTFSERVVDLSKQLMQAQSDRIQLQAYLDRLDSSPSAPAQPTSLPQISSDPVVQNLTTKLADTKGQLAETLAVYGPNHPNAKKLQNQVDELQVQLDAQRSAIFSNLKTTYTASKAREELLQSQMAGATKQMGVLAQYDALKKEADANTQIYAVLYQRVKEVAIAAETKSSSIRIIDRARVLNRPTKPKRVQNVLMGAAGGLVGGLALAFLLQFLDTKIRTPEDIKKYLGAESVSVIPVIGKGGGRYGVGPFGMRSLPGTAQDGSAAFLLDRPNSPESEALRGIYTAVRLSWRNSGGAARVLMIASALPGEGKTMLSVNLALALAQHGSTCIVDADLRKRGVASSLGVSGARGLGDVLSGSVDLDEAFVPHGSVTNLTVLPAGGPQGDPGTLIASNAMVDLVGKLRQRFEFVVIDSPPILPVSDARSLAALADGILLIGRSGVTTRENMKRAVEMLREVRSAPVLEYVLNAAKPHGSGYNRYDYGYGNDPADAG
ncbi:MAG: polysaccharide biosynthesis tyrosine autokinase [Candidatus Korobacteraceae bacterium]